MMVAPACIYTGLCYPSFQCQPEQHLTRVLLESIMEEKNQVSRRDYIRLC